MRSHTQTHTYTRAHAHALSFVFVAILGWIGGSLYPAPPGVVAQVSPQMLETHLRGDFESLRKAKAINWMSIQSLLGPDEAKRLAEEAIRVAQQTGRAIQVEHVVDEATKEAEQQISVPPMSMPVATPTPPVAPLVQNVATPIKSTTGIAKPAQSATPIQVASVSAKPAAASGAPLPSTAIVQPAADTPTTAVALVPVETKAPRGGFESTIQLCPVMVVSDAPPADPARHIVNFSPLVNISGAVIAVDPIRDACLSSGFGTRNGRLHKGIDFYNSAGGPILAGGDGTIIEMKYRDDYGNMVLIDHGHGVYTRYAHLSSFHSGLAVGAHVHAGDEIGLMGNTAGYPVPLHLHYEVLLGDYSNPKGSFGLTPHSPFEFRAAM